ncbi:MAG: ATP-binding cassette domain-containing protein [Candidatus Marinimicrobia bacterium]|jgi:ABC-type multidrug transport system ATPase subunit|nr:ATP-binding cassette domain-containing protein [Candidatus Neomarinimicrobiota bacterium]MBT3502323.1 ATP-binding cassette domain-containing protein [Candidatus Neomarinimicrobiota bacterium]MBT3840395.1 ATP-binding cassette domain-containing protein [Candidatus Neomarinimicrobiota bacterium]MBT3999460.1 ATP-binding cassette domain-containing protein [Candidatus Neomarinimicrobiota bacterium]MBT4282053.1 ATP-binding cassette domain-containing protein [Candidatus Neomarinimicrobiota bacterium
MAQSKRLIFKVKKLEKSFGSHQALNISSLEIHPGTIYGIIGTVGSGKSALLNILAGVEKETSGTVLYDENPYKTNWRGKILPHEEVFYSNNPELSNSNVTVSSYVSSHFGKKKNIIKTRYFNSGSFKNLWSRKLNNISQGERHWLGMIFACEVDPRVLLVDDYAVFFNSTMEQDFRNQLTKMNRTLGTTLVLSSPTDILLKKFASVLIYLDNGHISKIRSGLSRKPQRGHDNRNKRDSRNQSKTKTRKNQVKK